MIAPLVLVRTPETVPGLARRLAREGWNVREGFVVPAQPWDLARQRLVLVGAARNTDECAAAVLAAARGAGVVVFAADNTTMMTLHADLARVGPVTVDELPEPDSDGLPITDEQRALLERLANGESISVAANAEFLSLRTANRRLAQARVALGVRTTREAVLTYVRERDSS
ncbi:MAG: LuxR family transcriptional regulator [Corynebacteriales bacterium]|nr:LuxR family transcriptional regulator [Mycobacteriales bacterium]